MSKKVLFLFFPIVLFFSCSKETISPEIFELTALQDAVVYEVNFKAYSPTRNLQAVIDRLDDLDSLEVNVIWLMPIYPEGQVNAVGSPYAVADYTEVNPDLGDLNKLTEFVGSSTCTWHGSDIGLGCQPYCLGQPPGSLNTRLVHPGWQWQYHFSTRHRME